MAAEMNADPEARERWENQKIERVVSVEETQRLLAQHRAQRTDKNVVWPRRDARDERGWSDIGTAPRDTWCLVAWDTGDKPEDWDMGIARLVQNANGVGWSWRRRDGEFMEFYPTHWR